MATASIAGAQSDGLVGTLLGKDYLVLEQIGRGGMAVVYLVEHQTLHKQFAAKVLSADHATSTEARARFIQEASAASQLDHENIVSISDFGITADHRPFFVMELLRGQTLDVRLEQGPMPLEEVVAVAVPVARALAHAHAEGIVHRDVKPENIFLVQRSQGRWGVKVLDFGIAKVTTNPHLTAMGQTLGSPMFMSPEACRGDDVDQRADIYSFGIVLYLMLTGRVPFSDASLLKVLQMQVTAPLPPPRSFNPDISPELEAVLVRALAKEADQRYSSMEELLLDFEGTLPVGSDSLLLLAKLGSTSMKLAPFTHASERLKRLSESAISMPPISEPEDADEFVEPIRKRRGRTVLVLGAVGALAAVGFVVKGSFQTSTPVVAAAVAPPASAPTDDSAPTPTTDNDSSTATPTSKAKRATTAKASKATKPATPSKATKPTDKPAAKSDAASKPEVAMPAVTDTAPPATEVKAPEAPPAAAEPPAEKPPASTEKPAEQAPAPAPSTTTPPSTPPTPAPSAPPTSPAPTPKPAAPAIGSLDTTPHLANLEVNGSLPTPIVRRAVERALPVLRACYRTAAKSSNQTPTVTMTVRFEVDTTGASKNVVATGANLGTLDGCAKDAIGRVQTQAADVGTAQVAASITFRPI